MNVRIYLSHFIILSLISSYILLCVVHIVTLDGIRIVLQVACKIDLCEKTISDLEKSLPSAFFPSGLVTVNNLVRWLPLILMLASLARVGPKLNSRSE
jgi:hypothetical protein